MLRGGGVLEKHHCGGSLKEMQQHHNEPLAAGGVEPLAGGGGVEPLAGGGGDEVESEDDMEMVKPKRTKKSINVCKSEQPPLKNVKLHERGRYKPNQRINVDQVPFNLDQSARKVFVPAESAEHAQLSAPSGAHKRFGTLQITLHQGTNEQENLGMIFRGKGAAMKAEQHAYHSAVNAARHTLAIC